VYDNFNIGVKNPGEYVEVFNTDNVKFGGSGRTNNKKIKAKKETMHGMDYSITVKTPPIGGIILKRKGNKNV